LVFNRSDAVKHLQAAPSFWGAFKEVLKVVTAFTLAHSITLTLAALGYISLPSRLVESVIAASIIVAAMSNIRGNLDTKRWIMAFGFGLIHGFGFASVLADLGLPQNALITALIGFNVGVELGQLAIGLCSGRLTCDNVFNSHLSQTVSVFSQSRQNCQAFSIGGFRQFIKLGVEHFQ
jgi:xanthosine utilization system XapX-like protein